MKKLILLLLFCICLTGCSLLPKLPSFTNPSNRVPQQTEESYRKEECRGEAVRNELGEILSCSKGYYAKEKTFNQKERKITIREKVANFIRKASWWTIIIVVILIVFFPSVGGVIVGRVFNVADSALSSLVRGISSGKRYVRRNGKNFTDNEQKAYQQGADDMLKHISSSIDNPKVKKLINRYRAEVE